MRTPLTDQERELIAAYTAILNTPFEESYEDRWEDEPFDRAVEEFQIRSQEIGYTNPFEVLSRFKIDSYESIKATLKKGPPACFRQGWKSPLLGKSVDTQLVISKLEYMAGPKVGLERIVAFDFWASWCGPCVEASPAMSDMAEEYAGRVAVLGVNNESIFGETKPPNIPELQTFLDDHLADFRYTVLVDNAVGYAKDAIYTPCGYRGIPCVVLLVDDTVTYVGAPGDALKTAFEDALASISKQDNEDDDFREE